MDNGTDNVDNDNVKDNVKDTILQTTECDIFVCSDKLIVGLTSSKCEIFSSFAIILGPHLSVL